ncbi:hypothetical protein MASR2M78_11000 [Treponema sp.]
MHVSVVNDLLILVTLIFIFLLLSILRPYVRSFSRIEGFLVLPALSLLICIGIFPAFGFRPEILPLALFSLLLFIFSIPSLFDLIRGLRTDAYGERPIVLVAVSLIFLILVSSFALIYTPRVDFRKNKEEKAITSAWSTHIPVENQATNIYVDLFLPKTGDQDARYPLIILSPPLSASIDMVDPLVNALLGHGFMVLRYSRAGLDFPSLSEAAFKKFPSLSRLRKALSTFIAGTTFSFAALDGAEVEEMRRLDLVYLSSYIHSAAEQREAPFNRVDPSRLVLVGFGPGGSAGLLMAASEAEGNLAAVVAIESVLYSTLASKPDKTDITEERTRIDEVWHRISRFFGNFKIQLITGTGEVPAARIPSLFICSDRLGQTASRDSRYAGTLRASRMASDKSALAYVEGASLFAYSAIPETYPVYEAFARGLQDRKGSSAYYVDKAATLIANFASALPVGEEVNGFVSSSIIRGRLGSETHIEAAGTWNDAAAASILR